MSGTVARIERYRDELRRRGAGAMVLVSEAAVRHCSELGLYSQALIPQRPVACIVTPGATRLLVCELEAEQVAHEASITDVATYREFGDDPWAKVADLLGPAERVIVEDTMPASWRDAITAVTGGPVEASFEATVAPRVRKDEDELERYAALVAAGEAALAAGARAALPGVTEDAVATAVRGAFLERVTGIPSVLLVMAIAPANNRAMHHLHGPTTIDAGGPVRLGIVTRVDGWWLILTRMTATRPSGEVSDAYARYVATYRDGLDALRADAAGNAVYAHCAARAAANGFTLETLKVAHGTGLDFRELPFCAPHATRALASGTLLAYDYGLDDAGGTLLHVEDRVVTTADAPWRVSGAWALDDLEHGHEQVA